MLGSLWTPCFPPHKSAMNIPWRPMLYSQCKTKKRPQITAHGSFKPRQRQDLTDPIAIEGHTESWFPASWPWFQVLALEPLSGSLFGLCLWHQGWHEGKECSEISKLLRELCKCRDEIFCPSSCLVVCQPTKSHHCTSLLWVHPWPGTQLCVTHSPLLTWSFSSSFGLPSLLKSFLSFCLN